MIVGGRVGYMIFYQPERLLDNPLSLFYIWEGGMAFHGGLIGVIALTWIFARRHQVAPLALGDALAPLIPMGLGLGGSVILSVANCGVAQLIWPGGWFF